MTTDGYSNTSIKDRYEIYMTQLDITLRMTWYERIYYFFDCRNKIKMTQLIEVQKEIIDELYGEVAHLDYAYDSIKEKLEIIKSHLD
tara:strand:+ start:1060 stop:1320 length:261 start_codon:yes stop_codon:yes gene_type:complete